MVSGIRVKIELVDRLIGGQHQLLQLHRGV